MTRRAFAAIISLLLVLSIVFPLYSAPATQLTFPSRGVVNDNGVRIRSGPSTTNEIVGRAEAGQVVNIIGCNHDCTWYQVADTQWIAAWLVDVSDTALPSTFTPTPSPVVGGLSLTLVGWNVESGGALQNVVTDRLAAFQDVDIWGLSEVSAVDAEAYEFGAEDGEGADYDSLLGSTGRADRLLLMWDSVRFERVDGGELRTIGETGRAPLWVQLRERSSGQEFIVMVNHLHRSNDGIRHRQASALNAWATEQTLPIIALGDYNFDWNLPNGDADHDRGYDNLTANGAWEWVRPAELVTTQCSGWPCSYSSVLDFVFVAGPARDWNITSQIVVTEGDFPDDYTTPDHRPVLAVVNSAIEPTPTATVEVPTATATATLVVPESPTHTPAPPPTFTPVPPAPPTATSTPICDAAYPDVCIPPISIVGDLDCKDVKQYSRFRVLPPDPHGFDGNDNDGLGCESN